jgi:hypothetical protein
MKFFLMICPCSNVKTIIALCKITIPAREKDLLNFMSILDTLLSLVTLHHSITTNSEHNKPITLPTLPYEFLQTKSVLPKKRKSSLSPM